MQRELKGKFLGSRNGLYYLVPAILFVLVFAMGARTPVDSDLWWHLRAGMETFLSRKPLLMDVFSYTRTGADWTNHSWMAQLWYFLTFRAGGLRAISALVGLLSALSLSFVYYQMEGAPLFRSIWIVLGALVSAPVWSARPQLLSLVLFGAVTFILFLYKWKRVDRLWLLLPIFVLWSNLHGGYILGLIVIGCALVGELLNHILGAENEHTLSLNQIGRLVFWSFISGAAVIVNPNGVKMWLIPFQTVSVGVLQAYISEWSSPDFHQIVQQPYLWLFLLTFAAAGLSKRSLDGFELVSVGLFAYMGFVARRNFGPFAIVSIPVLSRHAWSALQTIRVQTEESWQRIVKRISKGNPRSLNRQLTPQAATVVNIILLLVLAGGAAGKWLAVTTPEMIQNANRTFFPVDATNWIKEHPISGNLFNSYNWGGYLIWELPENPVFVDGRTDLFGDEILSTYLSTISADAGWQTVLDNYDVSAVLIENGSELDLALLMTSGWTNPFRDDLAVIYVR